MKKIAFLALAAASLAFAQDAAPAPEPAETPAVSPAEASAQCKKLLEASYANLEEILKLLNGVTDRATADAAAEALAQAVLKQNVIDDALGAALRTNPDLFAEFEANDAKLRAEHSGTLEGINKAIAGLLDDAENPFFGSEALEKALTSGLRAEEEVEDEPTEKE
ncbi:MAG: hypothetical protein ACI4OX_01090 [Akkermansia sp.]